MIRAQWAHATFDCSTLEILIVDGCLSQIYENLVEIISIGHIAVLNGSNTCANINKVKDIS